MKANGTVLHSTTAYIKYVHTLREDIDEWFLCCAMNEISYIQKGWGQGPG